ncbi:MAG: LytTR family DNA-binding domain-containing protein [Bacteroidota bacterium]
MDNRLRAIIIDDEASARNSLKHLLRAYTDTVELIGEAEDIFTGQALIHSAQPSLIFLDIDMTPHTGFELLEAFPNPDFAIIFTTAYSEYAIQAIRASAVDYLLKPILAADLESAIQRVSAYQRQHTFIELLKENLTRDSGSHRIAISSLEDWIFIDKTEIVYLKAARRYTLIMTRDGEQVVSKPLSYFESLLTEPHFFRSHRSFMVNLKYVKRFVKREGGYIEMYNGEQVKLSLSLKDEFIANCRKFG